MDVLYVRDCKNVYLYDGNVVKRVECGYKKGIVTSVLEFENILSYDFFLDDTKEISFKVYEYLKSQGLIDDETIFHFTSYPLDNKVLITAFIVKKKELGRIFKEVLDVYRYIDYISLEPLVFRAYYKLYPKKGVDLFVVDGVCYLYSGGRFVLVREGVDFGYLRELGFLVERVLVVGDLDVDFDGEVIRVKESIDELRAIHNYFFRDFDVSIFHSPIPFYKRWWFWGVVFGVCLVGVIFLEVVKFKERVDLFYKEYHFKELLLKSELKKLENLKKEIALKKKQKKELISQKEKLKEEYLKIQKEVFALIKIYKSPLFYNEFAVIDGLLKKYGLKVKEFKKDKDGYKLKIVSTSSVRVAKFLKELLKSGFKDVKFSFIKKDKKVYADVSFD